MEKLKVVFDFETKSILPIKKVGAWIYSKHPSTEILIVKFYWAGMMLEWKPGDPPPELIFDCIGSHLFEAHNAFFERCIWENICVARLGWPAIPEDLWRCSMARASALALPRGLDAVGKLLNLKVKKDEAGHNLMLKMSRPRKPTAKNPSIWHYNDADFKKLCAYCEDDVRAEHCLGDVIPPLSESELKIWKLDQKINFRGLHFDRKLVESALKFVTQIAERLNKELFHITGGQVERATQRDRFLRWAVSQGLKADTLTARNLAEYLALDLPPNLRRALEIRDVLRKASTSKLSSFLRHMDTDDRVRGTLRYHGAATGRWTGLDIQPQNLTRATVKDLDTCFELLAEGDVDFFCAVYSNPFEAISSCIRGFICAPKGKKFYCADFASIEARVLVWLAGALWAVEMFEKNIDIYSDLASDVYGVPRVNIKKGSTEREVGKRGILGLGYGMGAEKFIKTCYELFGLPISKELAKRCVDVYREKYSEVKAFWYACENAAIKAVETGRPIAVNKYITYFTKGRFLYCKLPSGRCLSYPFPKIEIKMTPWGEPKKALTYIVPWKKSHIRDHTYGGALVENICQAVASDFMREAMLRLESKGYEIVLTVHDEILSEVDRNFGSLDEFMAIFKERPEWGRGCPIDGEGWEGERYKK